MAGFDSIAASPGRQSAELGSATPSRIGDEVIAGPGQKAQPSSSDHNDRGHFAHAGGENTGLHELPPAPPLPIDHQNPAITTGIDVSEFDNTINWQQVHQAGVQFAFVRATHGPTIEDANFVQNWQNAEKAGVLVGPYHYFMTGSPVQTQINSFVSMLKKVDAGNLPPVLDVEDPSQFSKYTVAQRVAMIQQCLDGIEQEVGVRPMLYMSSSFSADVLNNAPQFNSYRLWVADYTTAAQPIVPKPWTSWNFWQHADNGQVPGMAGGADLDYFNGPVSRLPVIKPATAIAKQPKS